MSISGHFIQRPVATSLLMAAILAVGAGEKRPVVKNDKIAIATVMTCTLAADHRVVDGATGAQFMKVLKELIEHPLRLVI